jgi:hypothetical protein
MAVAQRIEISKKDPDPKNPASCEIVPVNERIRRSPAATRETKDAAASA